MKYKAWFLLVLCNLFWAGNMIFGGYAASEFPPVWITFLRWIIALFFLIPMAHMIEKPSWFRIWKKNWLLILMMSVTGIAIYNALTYTSLQYTSPTNGSLINSLTPALIMLFSLVFLHEKINGIKFIGLVASFFGVLIVLTKGDLMQVFLIQYNKGDGIMILAILFWTAYSLISKRARNLPSITLVTLTAVVGSLMMLPFLFFQSIHPEKITALGIVGILYLGVFPSVFSFIFWNKGINSLGTTIAGVSMNLIPIFTVVIALILGQQLMISQVIGGIIVIVGMLLTSIKGNQRTFKEMVPGFIE
ncbi:DMT family transporter [Sporolactobacillus shoreae]|uniref:DMT family transporter n=1 Tax=Sporolactobacillus shoreae TaxID=1465501 RepID=A0A4Z0GK37_9BACL|nr:DMT family transporter [Sporolactobacillus shoreae]TGA95839.1 DMT family transporter [Sporolactobacillus shoreae]